MFRSIITYDEKSSVDYMKKKGRSRLSIQTANRQDFRIQIKVDRIEQKDCNYSAQGISWTAHLQNKNQLFSKPVPEIDESKQISCDTLKISIRTSVHRRKNFCN